MSKLKVGDIVVFRKQTALSNGEMVDTDVDYLVLTKEKVQGDRGKRPIFYLVKADNSSPTVLAVGAKEIKKSKNNSQDVIDKILSE